MKAVKNKRQKKFLSKKAILFSLLLCLVFPNLNGQENGCFMRFQNQFSVALGVVIPDWISTINQASPNQFSHSKTPKQWQDVNVPSPDRSPRVYNYHEIGIFCKLDVKLDKVSKFPVRFRLGTQELVDRKEGKY